MRTQETPTRLEDSSTYLARRRRNNEAARRCRERRRMEELLLERRAMELLQENQRLRAALCALYPGPRVADWPVMSLEKSLPIQPGVTGVPCRAWNAPPGCQPPAINIEPLPCHVLHPIRVMPPPSQTVGCPNGPGTAGADSSTRTLCNLPHKLRLKGARVLSWDKDGGSGERD